MCFFEADSTDCANNLLANMGLESGGATVNKVGLTAGLLVSLGVLALVQMGAGGF
jgi:hypothetical protein